MNLYKLFPMALALAVHASVAEQVFHHPLPLAGPGGYNAGSFEPNSRYLGFQRGYTGLGKVQDATWVGNKAVRNDSDLRGRFYQLSAYTPWVRAYRLHVTGGAIRWRTRSDGRDNDSLETDTYVGASLSRRFGRQSQFDVSYSHVIYGNVLNMNLYTASFVLRF